MGLWGGLFGGAAKIEAKADAALARGEGAEGYRLLRRALQKAAREDPATRERLEQKVAAARTRFVREKLQEAQRDLDDGILESAEESLAIVREHLTPGDAKLAAELQALAARLQAAEADSLPGRRPVPAADPGGSRATRDPAGTTPATTSPVAETPAGEPVSSPAEDPAALDATSLLAGSDAERFEQFSAALSPEDRARATQLGAAFREGFLAYQREDFDTARRSLARAAEEHPEDPLVLEQYAFALDQTGDTDAAITHYQAALSADPERVNARIALAQMLAGPVIARSPDARPAPLATDALALLEEGVRRDPHHAIDYLRTGLELALAARQAATAQAFAERALEASQGQDATIWQLQARALELAGDLEAAEEGYLKVVRMSGSAYAPRAEFGEFALRHGRGLQQAEELIYEICFACQMRPPDEVLMDAYGFLLSRIQYARGEYRAAREGAERLLAKESAPPPLREALGRLRDAARAAVQAEEQR